MPVQTPCRPYSIPCSLAHDRPFRSPPPPPPRMQATQKVTGSSLIKNERMPTGLWSRAVDRLPTCLTVRSRWHSLPWGMNSRRARALTGTEEKPSLSLEHNLSRLRVVRALAGDTSPTRALSERKARDVTPSLKSIIVSLRTLRDRGNKEQQRKEQLMVQGCEQQVAVPESHQQRQQ